MIYFKYNIGRLNGCCDQLLYISCHLYPWTMLLNFKCFPPHLPLWASLSRRDSCPSPPGHPSPGHPSPQLLLSARAPEDSAGWPQNDYPQPNRWRINYGTLSNFLTLTMGKRSPSWKAESGEGRRVSTLWDTYEHALFQSVPFSPWRYRFGLAKL